jgi:hypothetical protein
MHKTSKHRSIRALAVCSLASAGLLLAAAAPAHANPVIEKLIQHLAKRMQRQGVVGWVEKWTREVEFGLNERAAVRDLGVARNSSTNAGSYIDSLRQLVREPHLPPSSMRATVDEVFFKYAGESKMETFRSIYMGATLSEHPSAEQLAAVLLRRQKVPGIHIPGIELAVKRREVLEQLEFLQHSAMNAASRDGAKVLGFAQGLLADGGGLPPLARSYLEVSVLRLMKQKLGALAEELKAIQAAKRELAETRAQAAPPRATDKVVAEAYQKAAGGDEPRASADGAAPGPVTRVGE